MRPEDRRRASVLAILLCTSVCTAVTLVTGTPAPSPAVASRAIQPPGAPGSPTPLRHASPALVVPEGPHTSAAGGTSPELVAACPTITVTNPAVTSATVAVLFSQTFTQSGGLSPVTFSPGSALPPGLTLATDGTLSGLPTQTGTYHITVNVTDANNCTGTSPVYNLVIACPTITVSNPAVARGAVNAYFSQTFTQSGDSEPVLFTTTSALPAGLTLEGGGTLYGTPTVDGTYPITVTATDAFGCSGTGPTYTLLICPVITVTNPVVAAGTVSVPFSQTFSSSGGNAPVTFSTTSSLPPGLTLAADGTLSGTPTAGGIYPITVTATDANGCAGTGPTYTLGIHVCGDYKVPELIYYKFDEAGTSATANLASAPEGNNPAPLGGGLTMGGSGQFGSALVGAGGSSAPTYVDTGWVANLGTGSWTISMWLTTVPTTSTPIYFFGEANISSLRCFTNGYAGVNNLILRGQFNDVLLNDVFPGTFVVTFAYDAVAHEIRAYKNGVLARTVSQGAVDVTGSGPFQVGGRPTVQGLGSGQMMDEFRLYNRALGADEVAAVAASTLPVLPKVSTPALADGSVGVPYTRTLTAEGGEGPYTFTVASGALPDGITLDPTGLLAGVPTASGLFSFTVTAADTYTCTAPPKAYTLRVCPTITVTNPAIAVGAVNALFSQAFTSSGGTAPVTFATASALPAGLGLAADGTLSGIPTQTGAFPITVTATDANGCAGTSTVYSLVIGCQAIVVSNPAIATGTVNVYFGQTFTQGGGLDPVTFSTASALPTGLTLAANGVLSGIPTQSGSFPITVTATDRNGCAGTGPTYTLVVSCQLISVTNPVVSTGTAGAPFSQPFTSSGGIAPVTFSTTSALPTGLTLAVDGLLSGTPTVSGTFPITVTATDKNGCTGAGSVYTLHIDAGAPATITATGGTPQSAAINTMFAQPLQVTVSDGFGNPVSGATVAFAGPGSGASAVLSATSAATDGAGRASVTATANSVSGSYQVTASVAALTPVPFLLTNLAGAPTTVAVTGGSPQSATVSAPFAAPLLVRVLDAAGNPVDSVVVTFVAPSSGPSAVLSGTTASTEADGYASVTATAGLYPGTYQVTATVAGLQPVTFALTNLAAEQVPLLDPKALIGLAALLLAFGALALRRV
jgi:large repetitive protein